MEKTKQNPDQTPETTKALSEEERMTEDIRLLRALFDDLTPEDIPEEVWQKVASGESLAGSYALYVLAKQKEEDRIKALNLENEKKALGRIKNDKPGEEYFSPEAVRKMSPSEVRKHYATILKSMDSWN